MKQLTEAERTAWNTAKPVPENSGGLVGDGLADSPYAALNKEYDDLVLTHGEMERALELLLLKTVVEKVDKQHEDELRELRKKFEDRGHGLERARAEINTLKIKVAMAEDKTEMLERLNETCTARIAQLEEDRNRAFRKWVDANKEITALRERIKVLGP